MSRSSTSSSSRRALPLAGLLAFALVLAADRYAFEFTTFDALQPRISWTHFLEFGVARDRVELRALRAAPEGRPRVIVMGSSRADFAFDLALAKRRPDAAVGKVAHVGIGPFELRSAVDEILEADPDLVVWMISVFTTHQPSTPLPAASFGSLSAIRDWIVANGPAHAFAHRELVYQLALTALSNGYRYRGLAQRAGLDALRRFEPGRRIQGLWRRRRDPPPPIPLPDAEIERIVDAFDRSIDYMVLGEIRLALSLGRGPHVEANIALLERAAREIRASGAELLVFETPFHPLADSLYDPSLRQEFLRFARGLAADPGIRFVSVDEMPPFRPDEYFNLTHLNVSGRRKLTRLVLDDVGAAVASRDGSSQR